MFHRLVWIVCLVGVFCLVACSAGAEDVKTENARKGCTLPMKVEVRYQRNGEWIVPTSFVQKFVVDSPFLTYFVLPDDKSVDIESWQAEYRGKLKERLDNLGIWASLVWSSAPSYMNLNGSCDPITVQLDVTPNNGWVADEYGIAYDFSHLTVHVLYEAFELILQGDDIPDTLPEAISLDSNEYSGILPDAFTYYRMTYSEVTTIGPLLELSAYGREGVVFYTKYGDDESQYYGALLIREAADQQ